MKVVTAIDSFKGSMTSMEAGFAAAEGIHRVDAEAEVLVRPLADGGEGTVEALVAGMNGKTEHVKVTGPLGEPVICEYGIIESTKTAVIEMAGAAGITQVPDEKRNPLYTTTYGVGEVIKDAIEKGSRHFIIGIDGKIIQCIPLNEIAYCSNSRNDDTISIECCHPDQSGQFSDATYQSLVKLVRYLADGYGLSSDDVIRHYDVTGKLCPYYYATNPEAWEAFKKDVFSPSLF